MLTNSLCKENLFFKSSSLLVSLAICDFLFSCKRIFFFYNKHVNECTIGVWITDGKEAQKWKDDVYTLGRRQSIRLLTSDKLGYKIARNSVFDCHLSPLGQQMAIKSSVSNDFNLCSSIVLTFSIATYPVWISGKQYALLNLFNGENSGPMDCQVIKACFSDSAN